MNRTGDLIGYYEQELDQLAEQLHSNLTQGAVGAKLWLNACSPDEPPSDWREVLAALTLAVDETLASAQTLNVSIRPVSYSDSTIADCVADLADELTRQQGSRIEWSCHGEDPPLSTPHRKAIGRLLWQTLRVAGESALTKLDFAVSLSPQMVTMIVSAEHEDPQTAVWPSRVEQRAGPLIEWLNANLESSGDEDSAGNECRSGLVVRIPVQREDESRR